MKDNINLFFVTKNFSKSFFVSKMAQSIVLNDRPSTALVPMFQFGRCLAKALSSIGQLGKKESEVAARLDGIQDRLNHTHWSWAVIEHALQYFLNAQIVPTDVNSFDRNGMGIFLVGSNGQRCCITGHSIGFQRNRIYCHEFVFSDWIAKPSGLGFACSMMSLFVIRPSCIPRDPLPNVAIFWNPRQQTMIQLPRHKRKHYAGEMDLLATVLKSIQLLKEHGILVTTPNLRKLGLGTRTIKSGRAVFGSMFEDVKCLSITA